MAFGQPPRPVLDEIDANLDWATQALGAVDSRDQKKLANSIQRAQAIVQALKKTTQTDYPIQLARAAADRFLASDNRQDHTFAVETSEAIITARAEAAYWRERFQVEHEKAIGHDLSSLSVHAIRELLQNSRVPFADFVDDHVMNAVVQRNHLHRLTRLLLAQAKSETTSDASRDRLISEAEKTLKDFHLDDLLKPVFQEKIAKDDAPGTDSQAPQGVQEAV